jgi:thiol-disulfide isomerase/thioredoxin
MSRASFPMARRLATLVAIVASAGAAACTPNADAEEKFRPIAVGEPVPEFTVRTLEGDSARIASGEPVTLLHVWATWCGPCEKEFPEIEALQKEFGPRGLRIVAVSVDEGDEACPSGGASRVDVHAGAKASRGRGFGGRLSGGLGGGQGQQRDQGQTFHRHAPSKVKAAQTLGRAFSPPPWRSESWAWRSDSERDPPFR